MSPKLRIGILGTRGIPNRYGGFEQCAEYLALGLYGKGHDVFVYSSSKHEYQQNEWQGVNIIHCKDPEDEIGTAGQFIYDLHCINDARKRKFDVLLQLGYTSNSIWHWRWPKDTINIVNMDGLEWKRTKYNKYVKRFLRYAEKIAANKGDLLIADSLGIKEYLKEKYNKDSVFIPYGAEPFDGPDETILQKYSVEPFAYNLLIARLEPENNIQTIIDGHLLSQTPIPLLIVGNTKNKYGQDLLMKYKHNSNLVFTEGIYDKNAIDNLRFFSHLYFHGHSVGGTNPSLLEAMACHALIVAHDNIFNKSILTDDAFYFSNAVDIKNIIAKVHNKQDFAPMLLSNNSKIITNYSWPLIVDAYEKAMLGMI